MAEVVVYRQDSQVVASAPRVCLVRCTSPNMGGEVWFTIEMMYSGCWNCKQLVLYRRTSEDTCIRSRCRDASRSRSNRSWENRSSSNDCCNDVTSGANALTSVVSAYSSSHYSRPAHVVLMCCTSASSLLQYRIYFGIKYPLRPPCLRLFELLIFQLIINRQPSIVLNFNG